MIRNNAEVEMVEVEICYVFKDRSWFVPSFFYVIRVSRAELPSFTGFPCIIRNNVETVEVLIRYLFKDRTWSAQVEMVEVERFNINVQLGTNH